MQPDFFLAKFGDDEDLPSTQVEKYDQILSEFYSNDSQNTEVLSSCKVTPILDNDFNEQGPTQENNTENTTIILKELSLSVNLKECAHEFKDKEIIRFQKISEISATQKQSILIAYSTFSIYTFLSVQIYMYISLVKITFLNSKILLF